MRAANINKVKIGVKLAKPVYNSEANILLDRNVVLSKKYIDRIKKIGIRTIFIEDEYSENVNICDVVDESLRVEAIKYIRKLLNKFEVVKYVESVDLNYPYLKNLVSRIVANILSKKNHNISVIDVKNADNYTAAHSVNTAIISILIGINHFYSNEKLIELGLGSILHDIGKSKIPLKILNKPGRLNNVEFEIIQSHSLEGYKILKNFKEIPEEIKLVSFQHHEKVNGLGYPDQLIKNEINEYAKITAVADVFDALTSDRIYKSRMMPDMAIKIIKGAANTHFDNKILSTFIKCAQLYQLGQIVQINSGELGIITKYINEKNFTIKILSDENKNKLKKFYHINIQDHPKMFVIKTFDYLEFHENEDEQ